MGGNLTMSGNGALTSISLVDLTTVGGPNWGSLSIKAHAPLTTLELPSLTSVGGSLTEEDNVALAQCLVDDLAEQIEVGQGGDKVNLTGNNGACTCSVVSGAVTATCL